VCQNIDKMSSKNVPTR